MSISSVYGWVKYWLMTTFICDLWHSVMVTREIRMPQLRLKRSWHLSSLSDHAPSPELRLIFVWKANILRENLQQIAIIWVSDTHIITKYHLKWPELTFCDRPIAAKTCSVQLPSSYQWGGVTEACHASHVTRDHVQTQQPHPSRFSSVAKQPPEFQETCQARLPRPQRWVHLSLCH